MNDSRKWNGGHVSLGKKEFLISQIAAKEPFTFPCGGIISILKFEKKERYSFLNYITNGLDLSLNIAIDFTLSNKDPSDPKSLHCFDFSRNQYLKAITAVGEILENYDSSKRLTLLGFGGQVPYLMDCTSHCFAINGNIFQPKVIGLQGVIESKLVIPLGYKNALKVIKLDGPTYFGKIISYINSLVEYEIKQCKYRIG